MYIVAITITHSINTLTQYKLVSRRLRYRVPCVLPGFSSAALPGTVCTSGFLVCCVTGYRVYFRVSRLLRYRVPCVFPGLSSAALPGTVCTSGFHVCCVTGYRVYFRISRRLLFLMVIHGLLDILL